MTKRAIVNMITLKMLKAMVDLADKYNFPLDSKVHFFRSDSGYITNKDTNDTITLNTELPDNKVILMRTEVEQVFKVL